MVPLSKSYLKWAPKSEGEGDLQVPLFLAPALSKLVVTDQHLFAPFTEARVDMKGNVVASQEVHCEPAGDQKLYFLYFLCWEPFFGSFPSDNTILTFCMFLESNSNVPTCGNPNP